MKTTQNISKKLPYIINSRAGEPQSLSIVVRNRPYTLSASHENFKPTVVELKKPTHDEGKILRLVSKQDAILDFSQKNVVVTNGKVCYQGKELGGVVVKRILEFMRADLPFKPLLNFLQNLMANPSERARNELYTFLENENLPITEDGCILGYKGVKADWGSTHENNLTLLEGKLTPDNRILHRVGDKIRVKREDVDDNQNTHCSRGLHIGAHKYASDFVRDYCRATRDDGVSEAGHVVLLKFNPADAVSVPTDTREKIRVCAYTVEACLDEDAQTPEAAKPLTAKYANTKKVKRKIAKRAKVAKKAAKKAKTPSRARRNRSRRR